MRTRVDMSCNGCRVLRKGCSENCMLRQCLQWIEDPQAQAHATVFVAKFFGRAGFLSFISSVSEPQRPALFQSLLFEAVGRTISPVNGATGLLLAGNWQVCQAAVETVLRGGALDPLPEYTTTTHDHDCVHHHVRQGQRQNCSMSKSKRTPLTFDDGHNDVENFQPPDLDLGLTSYKRRDNTVYEHRGVTPKPTPSVEDSETTTLGSGTSSSADYCTITGLEGSTKLLRLFI